MAKKTVIYENETIKKKKLLLDPWSIHTNHETILILSMTRFCVKK